MESKYIEDEQLGKNMKYPPADIRNLAKKHASGDTNEHVTRILKPQEAQTTKDLNMQVVVTKSKMAKLVTISEANSF